MITQDDNLRSLTEDQIVAMDSMVKYNWAKELGYHGPARTIQDMHRIDIFILEARHDAIWSDRR